MGGYNFGSGIPTYNGIPMIGGIPNVFPGKYIWVKPYSGSDGNTGLAPNRAVKTLTKALSLATADKNDCVLMVAESNTAANTTDYQDVALDWNKDGVHLIGVNAGPALGQRSRIACTSTVKTIDDLFTLSADNCLIANIEVFYGVASCTSSASRAMVVSGQRNRIANCQISGMGDTSMDDANARSLAVVYPGSENVFQHCYIGLDTVIRATNVIEVAIAGTGTGTRVARTIFEDCIFSTYTSTATGKMVAHTYTDRFVLYKNCTFICANAASGAVAITGAFSTSDINGMIAVQGCSAFGIGDWTTADDTTVFISSYNGVQDDDLPLVNIGIASSSDVVD